MKCTYCGEPSEYVLHMTLCHVPADDTEGDRAIVAKEADVCLACGDTIIKNEAKRATWEDVEVNCGHEADTLPCHVCGALITREELDENAAYTADGQPHCPAHYPQE